MEYALLLKEDLSKYLAEKRRSFSENPKSGIALQDIFIRFWDN
jgi:hypothetical protein